MKHLFRTRSRVVTPSAAKRQRQESRVKSLRALAGVLILCQILLWITFIGYDRTRQAVWQAAALQIVPLIILYLLWKKRDFDKSPFLLLPLVFCLLWDSCFAHFALSGFISQLIPHFPPWVGAAAPSVFVFLTVYWAGMRGVSDGAWLLRGAVGLLFIFGTVFLRASDRADRLFPLLGKGIPSTLSAALHGSGCVWGVSLLFALPRQESSKKALSFALIPFFLGLVWALWYGFIRPWEAGDSMAVAEKMMGLARHASSVTLYEMAGLLWMVLLPLSLCGSAACGLVFVKRAFPKTPRFLPILLFCALPAALVLLLPGQTLSVLETLFPYRWVLSAASGLLAMGGRKR